MTLVFISYGMLLSATAASVNHATGRQEESGCEEPLFDDWERSQLMKADSALWHDDGALGLFQKTAYLKLKNAADDEKTRQATSKAIETKTASVSNSIKVLDSGKAMVPLMLEMLQVAYATAPSNLWLKVLVISCVVLWSGSLLMLALHTWVLTGRFSLDVFTAQKDEAEEAFNLTPERRRVAMVSLVKDLIGFIAFNVMIWLVWLIMDTSYPWFWWVMLGTGLAVLARNFGHCLPATVIQGFTDWKLILVLLLLNAIVWLIYVFTLPKYPWPIWVTFGTGIAAFCIAHKWSHHTAEKCVDCCFPRPGD